MSFDLLFTWQGVVYPLLLVLVFYFFYRLGRSDGIKQGISLTVEYLDAKGMIDYDEKSIFDNIDKH